MKTIKYFLAIILVVGSMLMFGFGMAGAREDSFPKLTGPYFNEKPPGTIPEVFAKNLNLKNNGHGGFAFSKKGNEVFFFSIKHNGKYVVMYSETKGGYWQPPRRISQSTSGHELHPFYSADGNKLFFSCNRRIQPNQRVPYSNLWFIERNDTGWSEPQPIPPIINTGYENCGSFGNGNTLYFRRVSPRTRGDIFRSEYVNEKFHRPVKLPEGINTGYDESHPAISPDGSYLIFSSKRPGGFNNDRDALWIAFKSAEGKWDRALNLGRKINNGHNTSCATISPDGKYIFFMRIDKGKGVPYWVSSKIIEKLRPEEL